MKKVVAVLKVLLAEVSSSDDPGKDPIYGAIWQNPAFDTEQRNAVFELADEHLEEVNPAESDWQLVKVHVHKSDDRSMECELDVDDCIVVYDDGSLAVIIGMELTVDQCQTLFA